MKSKYILDKLTYTGKQLRSHFAYNNFDLLGASIIAFIGPAKVDEHLVDLEDKKAKAYIKSKEMLHFIVEFFDCSLKETIARQRLLMVIIAEQINKLLLIDNFHVAGIFKFTSITRQGDDLFFSKKKLSVSIATKSPISTMIHTGLNISSKRTPVETIGLDDLKINAKKLAFEIMKAFCEEIEGINTASVKVKAVI
jgi:hypothetical protein